MRATKLRYTPKSASILYCFFFFCKRFSLKSFFLSFSAVFFAFSGIEKIVIDGARCFMIIYNK